MKNNWVLLIAIYIVAIFIFGICAVYQQLHAMPAVSLTDVELQNKFYAEENIKSEMNYLAMKHYLDNISVEEYVEVFYKVQHDK